MNTHVTLLDPADPQDMPGDVQAALTGDGPVALLGILANSAGAFNAQGALSAYLTRRSGLDASLRELGILAAAVALDCRYVFAHHFERALDAGATEAVVYAIVQGRTGDLDELTSAVVNLARSAANGQLVSGAIAQLLREHLTATDRADLVLAVTFYVMVSRQCQLLGVEIEPARRDFNQIFQTMNEGSAS